MAPLDIGTFISTTYSHNLHPFVAYISYCSHCRCMGNRFLIMVCSTLNIINRRIKSDTAAYGAGRQCFLTSPQMGILVGNEYRDEFPESTIIIGSGVMYVSVEMDTQGVVSRIDYGAPSYNIPIGLKLLAFTLIAIPCRQGLKTHGVWISPRPRVQLSDLTMVQYTLDLVHSDQRSFFRVNHLEASACDGVATPWRARYQR